jgi:hypothetical protein
MPPPAAHLEVVDDDDTLCRNAQRTAWRSVIVHQPTSMIRHRY